MPSNDTEATKHDASKPKAFVLQHCNRGIQKHFVVIQTMNIINRSENGDMQVHAMYKN